MDDRPLQPRDEQLLRKGLTDAQAALFDGWIMYVEKWVEDRSPRKWRGKARPGKVAGEWIADYQTAMSEALLALRRAAASYDGRGPFKPYLDSTLKNAMEDMRRREERHRPAVSIDAVQEPEDSEDGHHGGIDRDELEAFVWDEFPSEEDDRIVRTRPRSARKRFCGGWSEVFWRVVLNEAHEIDRQAYERGRAVSWKWAWRQALEAAGKDDEEIDAMIAEEEDRLRREDRNRQQRARRQRQRAASA